MDNFPDADCVIDTLFAKQIFIKKIWKLTKITTNSYDITLEFTDSPRIAGFTVYIKGTYHCIGLTALLNQSRRFKIPVDDIILLCAIK